MNLYISPSLYNHSRTCDIHHSAAEQAGLVIDGCFGCENQGRIVQSL